MDTAIKTAAPAKTPNVKPRFLWWMIGVGALLLISVPVTLYFFMSWVNDRELERLCAEIAADDPNWQWEDLIASMPPAPNADNAFVQIQKVNGLLKKTPFTVAPVWFTDPKYKAIDISNARISRENALILRSAFKPLDPQVLVEARKLKDFPKGRLKIDPEINPFELMMAEIQQAREVMHLLNCDVMLRGQDNDMEGAAESWRALLNTSHAIEDNPTLIGQLVRMAGQAIAFGALERMLAQGELGDADLARIQALLQRELGDNLLYFGLRGERAIGHRLFSDVRDGKQSISGIMGGVGPKGAAGGVLGGAIDLFPGIILRGYADHLRLLNEQVKATKLNEQQRMEVMEKIEIKAKDSGSIITRMLMPATSKVTQASQRTQTQLRCAMAAVAVERYRVKFDAWPVGFEELRKEGFLDAAPTDPFDGKPLRFKRTNTGILIYSVGFDKIDQDGKLDRRNPHGPGTDLGFELWNRRLRAVEPPAEMEK